MLKTQTRRTAKFVPLDGANLSFSGLSPGHFDTGNQSSGHVLYSRGRGGVWEQKTEPLRCPFGLPGDFLWVRETWATPRRDKSIVWYRARHVGVEPKWRPSIHMPRWASRISLRVEAVRVERLRAITEEDAKAEGVTPYTSIGPDQVVPGPGFNGARLGDQPHRLPFADLWRSINGAESWDANPWVWVITFARVDSIPEGAKARPIPFTAPMVRAILGSP